ncbi:MAG: hypothetical protein IJT48_10720 [Bacteroidaceae bacterium]|nr:hypothetical protein [Bacteroidaceae bacterium]
MKLLFSFLLAAMMGLGMTSSNPISKDGTYKGKRLWGKVEVVRSNADFTVEVVRSNANLNVEVVRSNASRPGEWEFVKSNADFTVEFVRSNADFTIEYVKSFPGVQ